MNRKFEQSSDRLGATNIELWRAMRDYRFKETFPAKVVIDSDASNNLEYGTVPGYCAENTE